MGPGPQEGEDPGLPSLMSSQVLRGGHPWPVSLTDAMEGGPCPGSQSGKGDLVRSAGDPEGLGQPSVHSKGTGTRPHLTDHCACRAARQRVTAERAAGGRATAAVVSGSVQGMGDQGGGLRECPGDGRPRQWSQEAPGGRVTRVVVSGSGRGIGDHGGGLRECPGDRRPGRWSQGVPGGRATAVGVSGSAWGTGDWGGSLRERLGDG